MSDLAKRVLARFSERTSAGMSWGQAVRKFEQSFKALVGQEMGEFSKRIEPKVADLFEQLRKDLGKDWGFEGTASASSVAKSFVRDVFSHSEEPPFSTWAVENFFAQGYSKLEQNEQELSSLMSELEIIAKKSLEDSTRRFWPGARLEVKDAFFKHRLDIVVQLPKGRLQDDDYKAMGEMEAELERDLQTWAKKKDVPNPYVEVLPSRGHEGISVSISLN